MRKTGRSAEPIKVSVIGAGRLGTSLAVALSQAGYEIAAVVCRSSRTARRAAKLIGSSVPLTRDRLNELPPSELILIATPDDEIANVASALASVRVIEGATVLHTSGALSSTVLKPLRAKGAHTGSLHPLVSISDSLKGVQMLGTAFYCLEGDRKSLGVAKRIVKALGGESFSISADKKPLYHASAVMCAGHTVALFDVATEMLSRCGVTSADAERILLPLLCSTVVNLERSGRFQALTGTFSRGDIATVQQHLRAIKREHLQDVLTIYQTLGRRSLQLSAAMRKKRKVSNEIEKLLDDPS